MVRLSIKLRRDEKGEFVLSEDKHFNISVKVGEEVSAGAQELIEKFDLAALNGTDRYTSGLPEPFTPMYFKAGYESGENIYFNVNGDPDALWCEGLAEYFLGVFVEYGEKTVLPARESVQIVRFDIQYFDGTVNHKYNEVIMDSGESKLMRSEYDYAKNESMKEEYIDVPENYYTGLESLQNELKLYKFINGGNDGIFGEKEKGVAMLSVYIEHADGSQESGSFKGEEITPEMLEKVKKIMEFIDGHFEL